MLCTTIAYGFVSGSYTINVKSINSLEMLKNKSIDNLEMLKNSIPSLIHENCWTLSLQAIILPLLEVETDVSFTWVSSNFFVNNPALWI